MNLGEIIKNYRQEIGISQDIMAEKTGLSKSYISILERNKNPKTGEPPIASLKTINAIAQAMNIDFDSIFSKLDPDIKIAINDQLPISTQPKHNFISKGPVPKTGDGWEEEALRLLMSLPKEDLDRELAYLRERAAEKDK